MKGPNSKKYSGEMEGDEGRHPASTSDYHVCWENPQLPPPTHTQMRVGIHTGGRWKERLKNFVRQILKIEDFDKIEINC